ncbi:DUF7519 family protein [Halococcoides cellulosivorans]|nr:hypothetical protein [Halococcoides cellulosivorans]
MSLDERPPLAAVALVTAIGTVATVAMVPSGTPLLAGALGTTLAAAGVALGSRRLLASGAVAVGAGTLAAGLYGLGGIGTATAGLGCLLVWDVGEQAISVTAHVGRGGRPMAAIGVHAAASTVAAGGVLAVVTGLASRTTGGQPIVALVLALVGGLFVVGSLRL